MQYKELSVSVTNGSTSVVGAIGTQFLSNVSPGNSFKVKGNPVEYTVASVTNDSLLLLSAPYQGATDANSQYQITRDFTQNLSLVEINIGDMDWPIHLTQGVIRKLDTLIQALIDRIVVLESKVLALENP